MIHEFRVKKSLNFQASICMEENKLYFQHCKANYKII